MNFKKAVDLLHFEEGYKRHPYYCSEGYPTVGIGVKIGGKGTPLEVYQFTVPLSVAKEWCKEKVRWLDFELKKFDWYVGLNEDRKIIILSMAYQMGIFKVRRFERMIEAIEQEKWYDVRYEMLDSRWANQTPSRANRHAEAMLRGCFVGRDFGIRS